MKKWVKYLLITVSVALFLFLMLPFLVPSSTQEAALVKQGQKATPQIFTSNPLTSIVSRLARLFGARGKDPRRSALAAAAQKQRPNEEFFFSPRAIKEKDPAYMAYAAGDMQEDVQDVYQPPQNVYVVPVDNNVEWVLVEQKAPADSPSGMHEVNVKEDAYSRYVKQERLARTTPPSHARASAEVPDSKLARLFKPLTHWFAKKETAAGDGTQLAAGGPQAPARGTISTPNTLGRNSSKQARVLPKAQDIHTSWRTSANNPRVSRRREREAKLTDLINPARAIKQSAKLLADTLYPNPSSGQQQQQKDEFYQNQQQNYQQQMAERLRAHLITLSEGAQPVDQLSKTAICDVTKGLINTQQACEIHYDDDDIARLREANRALFAQRTQVELTPTQLIPVLGVADASTLPQMSIDPEFDLPEDAATKEIYQFMLEKNPCSANSCYWVANTVQQKESLKQSVNASGVDFQGDPLHVYNQISEQFTQQKLASLPPDATDEQKAEVRQQVQKAAPPYVLYTQENMNQLRQQLQSAPQETPSTLYVASAADAQALAEAWQYSVPFFYGKQAQALTSDQQTIEDRAAILVNDLADHVIFMQGAMQEVHRDAAQQAVGAVAGPMIEQIQEQLSNEIETFNQNNPLGQTKK